jgi:hypothetical protein
MDFRLVLSADDAGLEVLKVCKNFVVALVACPGCLLQVGRCRAHPLPQECCPVAGIRGGFRGMGESSTRAGDGAHTAASGGCRDQRAATGCESPWEVTALGSDGVSNSAAAAAPPSTGVLLPPLLELAPQELCMKTAALYPAVGTAKHARQNASIIGTRQPHSAWQQQAPSMLAVGMKLDHGVLSQTKCCPPFDVVVSSCVVLDLSKSRPFRVDLSTSVALQVT